MKKMLFSAALAMLITGCAQQTFTVGNKPTAVTPKETITHHFFVSGIGQEKTVDADVFVPRDVESEQIDVDLNTFVIGYLPDGFVLQDKAEMRTMVVFQYADSDGRTISIQLDKSHGRLFKDTEDSTLNEFPFKDNTAIWWERDGLIHFVWQQNFITGNITADLSIEEIIKIAESVKIS